MAKKVTSMSQSSFSDLNDILNKVSPNGDMLIDSPFCKIDEYIGTGSYILNAALSGSLFGGLPNRRSLALAGEEGCLVGEELVRIYEFKSDIKQNHKIIKS